MPSTRQPTTREIAAASNYSQSAVSHALRGSAQVSARTRRAILKVARRLGWRPNPLASAYMAHLRSTRRVPVFKATLAMLFPVSTGGRLADQQTHVQHYYKGALARGRELGYALDTIWLGQPHLTGRRLGNILRSRGITGLIVPGITSPIIEELDWRHFTAVALAHASASSRLHRVTVDTFGGFAETLRRLHGLGYKRVGVVVSDAYDALLNHGLLFPAYYMKHELAGRCAIEIHRFPTFADREIPGIQAWLRQRRLEVVLGQEVTWQAIRQMGWRVPRDVAFASVDRAAEYPEIGGFDQRHALRGAAAVDLLAGQLVQNERGFPNVPRVVLVPGAWVDGASVPPARERARGKVVNAGNV